MPQDKKAQKIAEKIMGKPANVMSPKDLIRTDEQLKKETSSLVRS